MRGRKAAAGVFMAAVALLTLTAGTFGTSKAATPAPQAPKAPQAPQAPQAVNMQYGAFMALTGNTTAEKNNGFGWVEFGIYWRDSQPSPGASYQWGNIDNIINAALTSGSNLLVRVSRSPDWARDPSCSTNNNPYIDTCPPRNPSDFGAFMGALSYHIRQERGFSYSLAYEIWNEPNTSQEWGGMCPQPGKYTAMVQAAYPAVKGVDQSIIVTAGSITTVAEVAAPNDCHMDDVTFLQGMYDAGVKGYFDALADHPYGFNSPPEAAPVVNGGGKLVFRRAERHRDIMVQNGDSAHSIWATEMGWPVNPQLAGVNCPQPDWYFTLDPSQQADYFVRAFQWARSYWPWMQAMFVFNYDFDEAPWYGTCDAFRFWAIKNRPAAGAIYNFLHNPPATYTPIPTDGPPVILATRYSSTAFTRLGGTLTIDVDASDNDSTPVDTAQAQVYYPDGTFQLFDMSLVSGSSQQGTWRATVPIAQNNTGANQTYSIVINVIEAFPERRTTTAPTQTIAVVAGRFLDVPTDFWAYTYIENLADRGVISGYADGTFRPGNSTTRAQLTKITMLGFGYQLITNSAQVFADVAPGSPFYEYVQTAAAHGIIGGYGCGAPSEPCDAQHRPYFRPNSSITRGQITKIVVLSAGWPQATPASPTFADVLPGSPFYGYVESAAAHGIIGGYGCGGPGEPCDAQQHPYFRPNATTTRAQISKMVYLALQQSATATPSATRTPGAPKAAPTYTPTTAPQTSDSKR